MSEPTSNKAGGRVFRIDRECYVIYVGSDDHRVRPFLRVGTSSNLPDRIRPYIGTVVLSDRITGNPLQEAETVGAVGPRRPEYTGSPELVHAFSPLTGMDRVRERPISSSNRELPQGAFVEFLTDGNLHLTVNSRRIYDLDTVEQSDRHQAYLLDRVSSVVRDTDGAYEAHVFGPPGFLVGTDRSMYRFSQGTLTATALQSGAVEALSRRLIDPEWLTVVAGPADPEELLRWGKWRLRQTLLNGSSQPVIVSRDAGASEAPRRLDHLLEVLRVAGVPVKRAPVKREFDLPEIPGEPAATTLRVSGRGEWPAISDTVLEGVPLVPGVPYRVFGGFDALPSEESAGRDPAETDRSRDDAFGRLMNLLHGWNTETLEQEEAAPERFVRRAAELLAACPAPVWADVYPTGEGYSVRFMVQHGFSLKFARENTAAVQRIDTVLQDSADPDEAYRAEQRRLLAFLDELLEQRRATTRAPAPAKTPAESPAPESTTAAAASSAASATDAPPADESAPAPTEAAAAAAKVAPSPSDTQRDASPAAPATSSPQRTGAGSAAGSSAPGGSASGGQGRGGQSSSGSSSRGWRGPAFVVIGVVLIAGVVTLLLWRDDTGERYLARLGSDSEMALEADSDAPDTASVGNASSAGDGGSAEEDAPPDEEAAAGAEDGSAADENGGAHDNDGGTPANDDGETANGDASNPGGDSSADSGTDTGEDVSQVALQESDDPGADEAPTDGPLVITVGDIIRMVNRIAEQNGYAPIGSMAPDARDPDWIFPGNELELPDQRLYEIRRGDTMWAIADRFIRQSAQEHSRTLAELTERIQRGERPVEELQVLLNESYAQTTRRRVGELLSEIGVE